MQFFIVVLVANLFLVIDGFRGSFHHNHQQQRQQSKTSRFQRTTFLRSTTTWEQAGVKSTAQDAIGLKLIDIEVSEAVAALYKTAGQCEWEETIPILLLVVLFIKLPASHCMSAWLHRRCPDQAGRGKAWLLRNCLSSR
jgi:hypothetical protein